MDKNKLFNWHQIKFIGWNKKIIYSINWISGESDLDNIKKQYYPFFKPKIFTKLQIIMQSRIIDVLLYHNSNHFNSSCAQTFQF